MRRRGKPNRMQQISIPPEYCLSILLGIATNSLGRHDGIPSSAFDPDWHREGGTPAARPVAAWSVTTIGGMTVAGGTTYLVFEKAGHRRVRLPDEQQAEAELRRAHAGHSNRASSRLSSHCPDVMPAAAKPALGRPATTKP